MLPPHLHELKGIAVYGIVTGFLVALLLIAFVLAYCTKWRRLMQHIELEKANVRNK